jgi:hypothetical protein
MRRLITSIVLGIAVLAATVATPSRAEARPWRGGWGGWRGGWGGWRNGWWGNRYWYPRWGWGTSYYPYPAYYYPSYSYYPVYDPYYATDSYYARLSAVDAFGTPSQGYGGGTVSVTTGDRQQGAEKVNNLDALGLPNQNGRLSWPLALRILPPDEETLTLRNQIDALVEEAAAQAVKGKVTPRIRAEATRAVGRLHELLHNEKSAFTSSFTYDEADRFLDQLANGLKKLP